VKQIEKMKPNLILEPEGKTVYIASINQDDTSKETTSQSKKTTFLGKRTLEALVALQ